MLEKQGGTSHISRIRHFFKFRLVKMQQIDLLDELLANISTNVMQYNFDKAKDLCVNITLYHL